MSLSNFAQKVTVVNQNEEEKLKSEYVKININYDNDTIVKASLINGSFYIDSNLCSDFIDIQIDPTFGQIYHNQYLNTGLRSLDTIVINQTTLISHQTPRLLIGDNEQNLDSVFQDNLFFIDWLESNSEMLNGIYFWVYNTDPLKKSDKKRAKKVIREYCRLIGQEEFSEKVEFKKVQYITGQEDHFNEGTTITRSFIQGQNTEQMTIIAEKYSLTVALIIDWNEPSSQ